MTLPSATLFPQALLPLYIFEPRYRRMLEDALRTDRMFSVAMQNPDRQRESPCKVAGLGLIRVSVSHQDGTSHLILQGLTRVELVGMVQLKPYRIAAIRPLVAPQDDCVHIDALVAKVHELVEERVRVAPFPFPFAGIKNLGSEKLESAQLPSGSADSSGLAPEEILKYLESIENPDQLSDLVSCALLPGPDQRQAILETVGVEARLRRLVQFLVQEIRRLRDEK
jgi:ATP-dependent Lon protease